jgi:hypothetical protein
MKNVLCSVLVLGTCLALLAAVPEEKVWNVKDLRKSTEYKTTRRNVKEPLLFPDCSCGDLTSEIPNQIADGLAPT